MKLLRSYDPGGKLPMGLLSIKLSFKIKRYNFFSNSDYLYIQKCPLDFVLVTHRKAIEFYNNVIDKSI